MITESETMLEGKAASEGWTRAELYVMKTLERVESNQIEMAKDMRQMRTSVVRMKTEARIRSSIFGAISGVVSAFAVGLLKKFGFNA